MHRLWLGRAPAVVMSDCQTIAVVAVVTPRRPRPRRAEGTMAEKKANSGKHGCQRSTCSFAPLHAALFVAARQLRRSKCSFSRAGDASPLLRRSANHLTHPPTLASVFP
jgi:hypothetical protein